MNLPRDSKGRFVKGIIPPHKGRLGGRYVNREELYDMYWNRGMSINDIAKAFGVSYLVVWRRLNREGIQRRDRKKAAIAKRMKNVDLTPSKHLAYILGVLLGDGSAYSIKRWNRHVVKLSVRDREFAEKFMDALRRLGLNPRLLREKRKNNRVIWVAKAISKKFVMWFRNLTIDDIKNIVARNKDYVRAFLCGVYESEGNFYISKRSMGIRIFNTNKELVDLVKELLIGLGYTPRVYINKVTKTGKTEYVVRIYKRDQVLRFFREIRPCLKLPKLS